MSNQPELFAERPVRSEFGGRRRGRFSPFKIGVLIAGLAAVIGGISYLFSDGDEGQPESVPTIEAELPLKERPDHPGGVDIPHQDVTMFGQMEKGGLDQQRTEHLLPPPEVPDMKQARNVGVSVPPAAVAPPPAAVPDTSPAAVPEVSAPAPVPVSSPPPSSEKNAAIKEKPLPAAKSVSGGYAIQVASVPDMQAARKDMERFRDKYRAALAGADMRLVKADIAGKGTYYRVQSEPMAEAKARALCASIKSSGAACVVVKP